MTRECSTVAQTHHVIYRTDLSAAEQYIIELDATANSRELTFDGQHHLPAQPATAVKQCSIVKKEKKDTSIITLKVQY